MILDKIVIVKWNNRTKTHYEKKGYTFTKLGDSFDVKIEDVKGLCTSEVRAVCDYCSKIYKTKYSRYIKNRSRNHQNLCSKECKSNQKHNDYIMELESKFPNKFKVLSKFTSYEKKIKVQYIECGCINEVNSANIFKKNIGCYNCRIEKLSKAKREDYTKVYNTFKQKGYRLLEKKYVNAHTKMKFICMKHPDVIREVTYDSVKRQGACRDCQSENQSGDKHHNWQGGKTELNLYLRNLLDEWKFESLKSTNFRCYLTGERGDLEVHHSYSFGKIITDITNELGLSIHKLIGDYSSDDFKLLQKTFLSRHNASLGIPLQPKIHALYHSIYGYDNTPDQFEEFEKSYRNGKIRIDD